MDYSLILNLLKKEMGLHAEAIGLATVKQKVKQCMLESGIPTFRAYLEILQSKPSELTKLIEFVVIPETFFFRDKTPFIALGKYLQQFKFNKKLSSPLKILSLPCSTGEEPYSIAMHLFDMNIDISKFHIDGVDISKQHLEVAEKALYRSHSFRGKDLNFRNKYFTPCKDGYQLSSEVHSSVSFQQGNLLAENFITRHRGYDIIFCRNLLIYFDRVTKARAIKALSRLLSDDGVIFVGHAEAANMSDNGYSQLAYSNSFAFSGQKNADEINTCLDSSISSSELTNKQRPKQINSDLLSKQINSEVIKKEKSKEYKKNEIEGVAPIYLDKKVAEISKLLNEGSIDEAIKICEELIALNSDSARLHFLVGKTMDSAGKIDLAEEHLKKAIYLDPDYLHALSHLASLYERIGDFDKASGFHKREERVKLRLRGNS